ncbi:MAG: tetratricopeptide repeat protein [Bryobacteraceae bacterium]|nr:tetratricopeptide repeat protein [Bryobacteraceae bacterium]
MPRLLLLLGALLAAQPNVDVTTRLWQHRNLGKAFYENPTTQNECVAEFKQALNLQPDSIREKLNYGLALLRAANNPDGLKLLEEVQRLEPALPHTWFNLGIHWKKQGDGERALAQFAQMVKLVPLEAKGWYNLGAARKLAGQNDEALTAFERAAALDPSLAAARFQLYNGYRAAARLPEAQKQLAEFQRLKKAAEGAAIGEDVDWCDYAEIYDPPPAVADVAVPPVYRDQLLPGPATSVMAVLDSRGIGRADLLVATGTSLRLHRYGLPPIDIAPATGVRALVPADYNNDGLPDILVLTAAGPKLLRNSRTGFLPAAVKWPAGNFRAAVWLDFDHDYDVDLFLLGDQQILLRNEGAAGFAPHAFPFEATPVQNAEMVRLRPDSRAFDLLTVNAAGETIVYEDQLGGVYRPVKHPELAVSAPRFEADFNHDGRLDTADVVDGKARLRLNTANGQWLRVQLEGVRNPKLAPDAWVEVKAGTLYRRARYQGVPLLFSLGAAAEADTVRITWPNGLIQNETRQKANASYRYKEAQRLSGSCPIIWIWNGQGFEYVTDVLGVAPLGAAAGDGTYFAADHDEYVQLPASLQPRDGHFEVRLTEELSESAYIDQIALLGVDHAANEDLYTSEKWKSPPFEDLKLYAVQHYLPARRALDQDGQDVTAQVSSRDLTYPDGFRRSMSGIAERHTLTLDFAREAPADSLLILHGWVDWADGSTFLQAAQEGQGGLVAPQLQVRDARGQWVTVLEDMGMPAGKPKTITVEMRGLWRSASREVRIVTNLCVYWDQIRLGTSYRLLTAEPVAAPLAEAALRFRGFSPSYIHPVRKQPERFSYDGARPTSLWNPTPGLYTRYGAVDGLLRDVDDRLTVMGSGDEIRLRFRAPAPPASGRRSYLLKVDGWAKDRDANTSNGQTVQPLPFHRMSGYPLGAQERHPNPAYEREYNTRPALRLLRPLAP